MKVRELKKFMDIVDDELEIEVCLLREREISPFHSVIERTNEMTVKSVEFKESKLVLIGGGEVDG